MIKLMPFILLIVFYSNYSYLQSWQQLGTSFSQGEAEFTEMVVNQGTPYVVYCNVQDASQTNVQKFNGSTWEFVGVPNFTDTTFYQCLAISDDTIYVAFMDVVNDAKASVMKFNGTNWVYVGSAGFTPNVASEIKLYVTNQTPYIVFRDGANSQKTSVMKFNGSGWEYVGPPGFSQITWTTHHDIWVENDTPYVTYSNNSSPVSVKKFNGSTWEDFGQTDITSVWSSFHQLYFDQGTPYLVLKENYNNNKGAAYKFNGNNWEQIGNHFSSGGANAEGIYVLNGIPFVIYSDLTQSGRAQVKFFNGSSWTSLGANNISIGQVRNTSIQLDNGIAYINFIDDGDGKKTAVYTIDFGLNVDNLSTTAPFSVHPNPTNGHFKLDHSKEKILSMTIMSMDGRLIEVLNSEETYFDISHLPNGTYILTIKTSSGAVSEKILKF